MPVAADVVEHGRDAAGRDLAHARGHVLRAVVDGDRAERGDALLLRRPGDADDGHPRVAGELDEQRADAAGRTEHDDRLPGPDARASDGASATR